jgi:hypothetical protein
VCDLATPQPLCSNATVTISAVSRGPTAVDDSVQTPYFTPVTVNVLSNDIAGAQPLQTSSLSLIEQPTNGVVTVTSGQLNYIPNSGFTGSNSLRYQVCDNSTPTPLCSTATLTVIVEGIPQTVVMLRCRLVKVDYDLLGNVIRATVQTQTPVTAK